MTLTTKNKKAMLSKLSAVQFFPTEDLEIVNFSLEILTLPSPV